MIQVTQLAQELAADETRGVATLFRRAGLRQPFVLWQPDPDDLPQPVLRELARRWYSWRDGSGAVAAARFDPSELGELADWVIVVTPAGDAGAAEHVHEGREILRHRAPDADRGMAHGTSPLVATFLAALYRAVIERGQPVYSEHQPGDGAFVIQWDRLVLPLLDEAGRVARFVVGCVPETPVRSIVDTVMDAVLLIDDVGRIRIANPAAAAMFGWPESALVDRRVDELIDGDPSALLPTGMCELRARRHDGGGFYVEASIGEATHGRSVMRVVVLRDVSRRRADDERIRRLAFTDALTGIANRAVFEEQFRDAVVRARREQRRLALVLFDLDRLKAINDRHGHPVGDAVLREVAERTRRVVRQSDLVARLGGDEFAVLLDDIADQASVRPLVARLVRALHPRAEVGGVTLRLRASFGIGVFPDDAADAERLIEVTDQALYVAKAAPGRRTVACSDLPRS